MQRAEKLLCAYAEDDGAAMAVEYALIASIISIAILITATNIGINLQRIFGTVSY